MRTVSTSKVSSSLMLKCRSSSRWGLLHRPRSLWHQSHSPGRLSSSEYDTSYVHNSNIKRLQLNICTKKPKLDHYYSSRVDYRFVESFLENSQLTWCIHSTVGDGRSSFHPRVHYTKMSSTRERRRSDPHDNSRDSSSSHIYMVELSLTDSSQTFATVGDGSSSFRSRVHYTKLSSTRERRRSYPHDNSRDSSSSHIWWRLNRLKVNPKYRLIIFLKEDLAGLTSMSEGVGDWDDGGDVRGVRWRGRRWSPETI